MPGAEDDKDKSKKPGAEDIEKDPKDPPGEELEDQDEDDELYSDPAKAKALVKSLRAENAKNRIKSKEEKTKLNAMEQTLGKLKAALGDDDKDLSPEDQIKKLKSEKEQLIAEREAAQTEAEVARIAREYEIPPEHDKYFRFLLAQKFEGLKENEELGEEDLEEIVKEVRAISGKKGGNKTGIDGKKPAADTDDELSVEKFSVMNMGEKGALYTKNPALYERLFKTAMEKGLL